jgi:hypothetical protein
VNAANRPGLWRRLVRVGGALAGVVLAAGVGLVVAGAIAGPGLPTAVAGFKLLPTSAAYRSQCHRLSRRLGFPVPCLAIQPQPLLGDTLLCTPIGSCLQPTEHPAAQGPYGYLLSTTGFAVPPGYVGVPGPFPEGHLVIRAERYDARAVFGCGRFPADPPTGGQPFASVSIRQPLAGTTARVSVRRCPVYAQDEIDGGHIVGFWLRRGIAYSVSLHGWSQINERVVEGLIASVRYG